MVWVRNVFLKYGWLRNVLLNYEDGGETSFLFMGKGRNVFPKYELRAKRLTKKWCKLTMGRKVCVPGFFLCIMLIAMLIPSISDAVEAIVGVVYITLFAWCWGTWKEFLLFPSVIQLSHFIAHTE